MEPVKGGVLSPSETATGHDHLINDLDDVETAGAEEGDGLVFTGDGWVPGAVATGTTADEVNIRTDQPPDTVELWVDTDEVPPVAFALGKVASAVNAAADATALPTTVGDLPSGLSCTWTADPTRLYKITVTGNTDQITAAAQQAMYITDAANTVIFQAFQSGNITAGTGGSLTWTAVYTESGLSGSVTRKVRMLSTQATGRMRTGAPFRMLVEDIGLA